MRSKTFERILNKTAKDPWWVKAKRMLIVELYAIKCLGLFKYIKMRNLRLKTKTTILVNCLLWLVVFCGCNTNAQQCDNHSEPKLNDNYSNEVYISRGGWIETIMYDSCEYLVMGQTNNGVIIHKGNCKFCADRSKNN